MNNSLQSGASSSDWLMGLVKKHPEGLLLLAAGCALMMRGGGGSSQSATRPAQQAGPYDHMGQQTHGHGQSGWGVGDKLSQATDGARQYASEIAGKVGETAGSYVSAASSAASSYVSSAPAYAAEQTGYYAQQAQSAVQNTISRVVQDQPLAVALAGLAAGAALAAAFPATDIERNTLGPAGQRIAEAAGQLGEQLKEGAVKAGESLKSAAEERGLNAEGVKEVAREAAGAFGSAFSGERSDEGKQSGKSAQGERFGNPGEWAGAKTSPSAQGAAAWSEKEMVDSGKKRGA